VRTYQFSGAYIDPGHPSLLTSAHTALDDEVKGGHSQASPHFSIYEKLVVVGKVRYTKYCSYYKL